MPAKSDDTILNRIYESERDTRTDDPPFIGERNPKKGPFVKDDELWHKAWRSVSTRQQCRIR